MVCTPSKVSNKFAYKLAYKGAPDLHKEPDDWHFQRFKLEKSKAHLVEMASLG